MQIDARHVQFVIAAAFALGGALGLLGRAVRATPRDAHHLDRRLANALLAVVALAATLTYFGLGRHPEQFVKTWDVKHTYFGSKYARELGYFRIYECILLFDAQTHRRHTGVRAVHDLRTPVGLVPAGKLLRETDCGDRFDSARRREFVSDLAFFDALPRQPNAALWFADNGYNMTPFFTALTAPLFDLLPLGYGVLLGLSLADVALELLVFLFVFRTFGARLGLLSAIFFFVNFSNQFAAMGGAILRFGYVTCAILAACALLRGHHRTAGVCLGIASLLQVFPAAYALGLLLWAAYRGLRERRVPEGVVPFCAAFALSVALGLLWSFATVGIEVWREFLEKMALHNLQLSQYRVGLKLLFVLDFPLPPDAALAYAEKLDALRGALPLYALGAAALVLAALSTAPRLSELEFALLFGTVVLYVLTPVHYYFSTLVLLFFLGRDPLEDTAARLVQTLLFGVSAGAFLVFLHTNSLVVVNSYWLSIGLLVVLAVQVAVLHAERGVLARARGPR
ncbi:MAG: hypothetical protein ACYSUM_22190 [Planctomycetota bacterium]|jgi:hypothetical protein